MLKTDRLYLRLMRKEDAENIVNWRNDPKIRRGLFSYELINEEKHLQWYNTNANNTHRMDLMVCFKETEESIGTLNFSNIDFKNQKAEFGILIAKKFWGKGYATEAAQRSLEYGFQEMNLNKIYLKVFNDNQSAINLYKKLGFNEEGLLKEDIYKDGEFKNVKVMSLLKKDWINCD